MADPAEDPDPEQRLPRWQVQPWLIKASLVVSCLVALYAAFGADRQEDPSEPTIVVPQAPVDRLTTRDVQNLRAFVEQALEDDRLQRRTRRQLTAILELLDGVDDGSVSLPPVDDGSPGPGSDPTGPRPGGGGATGTSSSTTTTTTTTTPSSPRPPLSVPTVDEIRDMIADDFIPTTTP